MTGIRNKFGKHYAKFFFRKPVSVKEYKMLQNQLLSAINQVLGKQWCLDDIQENKLDKI